MTREQVSGRVMVELRVEAAGCRALPHVAVGGWVGAVPAAACLLRPPHAVRDVPSLGLVWSPAAGDLSGTAAPHGSELAVLRSLLRAPGLLLLL